MGILKPVRGTLLDPTHRLSKGLVGMWLFNEGTGKKAFDLSGHGNHGTLTSMAFPPTATSGWGVGKFGNAIGFDGTDDSVDGGNGVSLNITDVITLNAWIYTDGIGDTTTPRILAKDGSYYIYHQSPAWDLATVIIDGVNKEVYYSSSFNAWHLLSITYDGTTLKMYIDGVLVDDMAASGAIGIDTTQHVIIGNVDDFNKPFYGTIDSVSIYNRALTAQEVQQLYYDPFCMFKRFDAPKYITIDGVLYEVSLSKILNADRMKTTNI